MAYNIQPQTDQIDYRERLQKTLGDVPAKGQVVTIGEVSTRPTSQPALPANGSIVDYMNTQGMDSSYNNRASLAKQYGIQNYAGTAEQNTQLLSMISGGSTPQVQKSEAQKIQTLSTPQQQDTSSDRARAAASAGMSASEYRGTVEDSTFVSQKERKEIMDELGIDELEAQAYRKPSQTSQELYDSAYKTSGLADLKQQITQLNDQISKERKNLAEAVEVIDENPFLSEQSRVGRGKRLLDQAEARISNIQSRIDAATNLYNTGIQEINNIVTRNQNDFTQNQNIDIAKLNYLQAKAEKQVEQLYTQKVREGMDMDTFLTESTDTEVPKVIGTADTGYFSWDPLTKKFVSTGIGGGTSGQKPAVSSGTLTYSESDLAEDSKALEASRGADGYVDPTVYKRLYDLWIEAGGLLNDFLKTYPPKNYVNPENTWLPAVLRTGSKSSTSDSGIVNPFLTGTTQKTQTNDGGFWGRITQ